MNANPIKTKVTEETAKRLGMPLYALRKLLAKARDDGRITPVGGGIGGHVEGGYEYLFDDLKRLVLMDKGGVSLVDEALAGIMGIKLGTLKKYIEEAKGRGMLFLAGKTKTRGHLYNMRDVHIAVMRIVAEKMQNVKEGFARRTREVMERRSHVTAKAVLRGSRTGSQEPEELAIGEKYNVTNAAGRTCTGIYRGWSNPANKLIRLLEIAGRRVTIFGLDAKVKRADGRRKLSVMDFDGTTAVRSTCGITNELVQQMCTSEVLRMQYEATWEKVKKQLGYE